MATLAPNLLARRPAFSWLTIAVFLALFAEACGAQVSRYTSASGTPIEPNILTRSDWLDHANAVWLYHEYAISIDCSPPRACYAKYQLVNYHFNCHRGFVYVRERISMDLNGNVINHQVFEHPTPLSSLNETARDLACRICGCPDLQDWLDRRW